MPVTERENESQVLLQRDQYIKGGLGRWYWDFRDSTVFSLLNQNDRKIIDLGCGEGVTLQKLVSRFPQSEVTGIDLLDENVNICLNYGLPVRKGDVYGIDLPNESVDAVLFLEVVEHLKNPRLAIGEIHRILRPGGKLVLMFPNDKVFKLARLITLRFKEAFYDPGHLKQWSSSEMWTLLTRVGFTVYYSRLIPFWFWKVSLHCVMAARKGLT
jgi:SAM-dependent methyltransferase